MIIECNHPGLSMEDPVVEEIHNAHGQDYWKATAQIGSMFGCDNVHGECIGIGKTKEIALQRLAQEIHALYESMWI